jgi:hypothetical protein
MTHLQPGIELDIISDADTIDKPPPSVDEFCHIESGDGRTAYCGHVLPGQNTCQLYNGEALCPSCGLATCPTCAVMSNLNERLLEESE